VVSSRRISIGLSQLCVFMCCLDPSTLQQQCKPATWPCRAGPPGAEKRSTQGSRHFFQLSKNIPPGSTDDLSLVFSLALAKAALPLFVPPISLPGPIPVWLQRPYKGTGFTVDKIRTR
jgi:hypothetical protein